MIQADTSNNTRRRDFLALTAAVATTVMAARPALASPADDSALLAMEEQWFEQKELAESFNADIIRLGDIWNDENHRLFSEASLSPEERWQRVAAMPECVEHTRLLKLQDAHYAAMEDLVKAMWATPALTPEGRRAKVLVALNMLPEDWREGDWEADFGIRETRQLLIEFVGGDAGARLRDQFRSHECV